MSENLNYTFKGLKDILYKIDNYGEKDAEYYGLCVNLMDIYWKIRKNYPYGDKVIAILFYHDFLGPVVRTRQNYYWISGKYEKYKDKIDDYEDALKEAYEGLKDDKCNPIIEDSIEAIRQFVSIGYLPYFNGYWRQYYLTFTLDKEIGDYIPNLEKSKLSEKENKELYEYIKNNPLDFLDEIRNY